MEIKTRPDIGRDLLSADNVVIDTGSALVTASPDRFATFANAAAQTTQTVTASPATVSARFIVLDDDSHTSGTPGVVRMPPITEGAWHVIATPYEDVHYEILQDAGDPANTGPDYQIGSAIVRQQMVFVFAAESEGQLRWQYDSTGSYLSQLYTALFALTAFGAGAQVISTTSDEITGALDVYVTNASAAVAILLPDAAAGRRIRLHKYNNAATQTITLVRSAGDTASGVINGVAASYNIVFSDGDGPYRSWDVAAPTTLAWHVSDGVDKSLTEAWAEINALDTRVDTIEADGAGVQIITGTSGTISGALDVYLTNAGATLTITLPTAAARRRIRVHKANSATTQTITFVRSAADISGGATINGTAASFDIVMTSIAGTRRAWDVSASAALEWHVDSGETSALTSLASSVSINTSNIATNTTDITSLKNGVAFNIQIVSTATATISAGTTHVFVDYAAARCDLTLPATSVRFNITIVKRATSGSFGIRLIPASGSDAIQGLAAGTSFDIPGSTTNASTATTRPAFLVMSPAANVVDAA